MASNKLKSGKYSNKAISSAKSETVDLWHFSSLITKTTPILLILLSLVLIVFHSANNLLVERMRMTVVNSISPILSIASSPVTSFVNSIDGVTDLRDLRAENINLKKENEKLRQWYEAALALQAENKSFKELLNVKVDKTLSYITARIISDAGSSFVKSVLLPVGTQDNIQKGSAVMSGRGLVGRVTEVGRSSSRVLLITDLNSRIPVIIQNTRTRAILAGKNKGLMKLERLPHDSGITVGSRIATSGDGGQLPADVPIGVIVSSDSSGVWVKPLSDISKLTHVQVVNADIDQSLVTGDITD